MADLVTVVAVAGQHSMIGALQNSGMRVIDVLNDPGTEFIRLHEVVICRGIHDQCVKRAAEITVRKAMLDFVLLEADKHEAPLRRQHTVIEKRPHDALVLVGDYEVHGTIMLRKVSDLIAALNRELSDFFPLMAPRLLKVGSADGSITSGLALVNKSRISLLHFQQPGESTTVVAAIRSAVEQACQT
jgi:hypothetical protein